MKGDHVLEELSAYIDGEARDAARIARHLQTCEQCARRHIELLKISTHLHALPLPEAQPEFVTRVMAHVRDLRIDPQRKGWGFMLPTWAVAAVAVLLLCFDAYLWFAPVRTEFVPNQPPTSLAAQTELAAVLENTPGPSPSEEYGEALQTEVSMDDVINVLLDSPEALREEADVETSADLFEAVEALSDEDSAAFQEVFSEYLGQQT
jgi:hypothetical protein